jgi:hypothetical protein
MVKILIGVLAAIAVAAGGFFGFEFYAQNRIVGEVEAAFEQIRAAGGKASLGKVSFDFWSRTVTITDIAGETGAQPPVSFRIAGMTASGVGHPDPTRLSADSIEITDAEVGVEMPTKTLARVTYRSPQIAVRGYSGPATIRRLPASSSFIELYRFGFEQLASMRATSVVVPSLTGKMKFSAAMQGGAGDGEFTYSNLVVEGIRDGKVATMKTDDCVFTFTQPAGKAQKITGNLANFVAHDTDFNAMAAIYDTQKADDDRYYSVYRQISAGTLAVKFGEGQTVRIEGVSVDDVAMRPSRLQLPALMAMTPPAGAAPPTPAQTREFMQKAASVYEGVRIGNAEMHGLSVDTAQGPLKLSTMRFNFDSGKIGELAFEGLDAHAPKGPIKLERFVLKSLDFSGLMRTTAQFDERQPSPNQALALLPLIEGVEVNGFVAPYNNTDKPVNIDNIDLNWGQFVGPIPTKARLTLKMSAPLDARDPGQKMLVAAGLDRLAIDFDLGATWSEASRAFALEPVKLDFAGQFKASARVLLANVPKQVFSVNPAQAMAAAAQIQAGTIELTVQDIAGVDRAIAQLARATNVSREAFRTNFVEEIRASGKKAAETNPDAAAAAEAFARFIETPGQTLILKLTPLGKVPALQLMQLWQTDPMSALVQFKIEASTGL